MALLIVLAGILFSTSLAQAAYPAEKVSRAVLFDSGNPQNSVGRIGRQFVESGDDYEHYQVVGFEPQVILLKDHHTAEVTKIPARDRLSKKWMSEGRHRFVARQLKAIYEAQSAYIAKYRNYYAPDLDTLIREELLADGFVRGIKQDYYFNVDKVKAEFGREPEFFVTAVPVPSVAPDLLFSVDQLGQVRFADTRVHLPWGPVWDYRDLGEPRSRYIGTEKQPS